MSTKLNFGLGNLQKINKIEIRWPDQKNTIIENISLNQLLTIDYNKSEFTNSVRENYEPLFTEISNPHISFCSYRVKHYTFN